MSPHPFHPNDHDDLLLPCEVARLFRVDPKTVTRWAKQGHLRSISTLGGHRRYYRSDIEALLTTDPTVPPQAEPQPAQPQPSQPAGPGRDEAMPPPRPEPHPPAPPPGAGTGSSGAGAVSSGAVSSGSGAWVASTGGVRGRVVGGEGDGGDASVVESR